MNLEQIVKKHSNAEIEFTKIAEAKEYRETLTLLEKLNQSVEEGKELSNYPANIN